MPYDLEAIEDSIDTAYAWGSKALANDDLVSAIVATSHAQIAQAKAIYAIVETLNECKMEIMHIRNMKDAEKLR